MKKIFFLSGLPRTGSTVLGSILCQNPDIYVTPTSALHPFLVGCNEQFNVLATQYTLDPEVNKRVYRSIINAFFEGVNKPIVFDKQRGWPKFVESIKEFLNPEPRIVCTVRPIAEIITSYLVLAEKDPNNFIDAHLRKINGPLNNEARAHLLWTFYLNKPYEALKTGLQTHRKNLLLIDYRDLVYRTERTLKRIYHFCDLESYVHSFDNITNGCAEAKDAMWGLKGLHDIRSKVDFKSKTPKAYLPTDAINWFSKFDIEGA